MKKILIYLLLIVVLVISLNTIMLNRNNNINEELKVEIAPIPEKTVELITLYFPDAGKQYLTRENRVIEHTVEQRERIILEELIKGPTNKGKISVIPTTTKLYSVVSKNGIAYINLSNEFKSDMQFGGNNEILAIYSIVNSLTELKTIKSVQISVDGQTEGVLQKYMPLDYAYKQNLSLVDNPIRTPIEVVKDYFNFIKNEDYRNAFDLLYNPSNVNIDYSMYYHFQKERGVKEYNIYSYEMIEYDEFIIVKFDYSEKNWTGNEVYYKNKDFKFINHYGEWKIVIEDLQKFFNNNIQ